MMTMVIRKVYLRPTRSPSGPKTRAPSGRTRKPAAKARRAAKVLPVTLKGLKNCAPMNAASVP
jgi:hypothetical protein